MTALSKADSGENKAKPVSRPLKAVAFLDGRPGHEKQTRGVLKALSALTPVVVKRLRIRLPSLRTRLFNWLPIAAGLIVPSRAADSPVDLVIGTGSATHIPMLLYNKRYGTHTVTCMTPDLLLRCRMDLCLVPRHDRTPPAANIFYTSGPPNHVICRERHDSRAGLILVGGVDPKSHHWRTETVIRQVETLLKRKPDDRWTLSSSPRTPADTCAALQEIVARYPPAVFFRSADTPDGWVEAQYARCESVWVTADSVSMIFEALTAGCRVGVLPVAWKRPDNKFERGLRDLKQRGMITDYAEWIRRNERMKHGGPLNEADRCAREILRRWWPDRLA